MSSSLSNFEGSLSPSTLISILVSIYIRQYTGRFVVNNTRKTRVIGILSGTPVWINRDDMERSNSNITDQRGNVLIKNDRLDGDFQAPRQPVQRWDHKVGASGLAVVWAMRVPGNLWPGRQNCEKTTKCN